MFQLQLLLFVLSCSKYSYSHLIYISSTIPWAGQESCSGATERWCVITPAYTTLNINPGQSEIINCTIPSTDESSIVKFVNQFGKSVTDLPNVNLYPSVTVDSATQVRYDRVNISWTFDKDIRQKLKVIQCIVNFQCQSHPCKTAINSINFLDNEQGMLWMASVLSGKWFPRHDIPRSFFNIQTVILMIHHRSEAL